VDQYFYAAGVRQLPPVNTIVADSCAAFVNHAEGGYEPGPELLALPRLPQRTILETWGDQPGDDRYSFITPEFSAGSTSSWYGAQDQQISVQLAERDPQAPPALATISVCGDSIDAPYGKVLIKDRTGHAKPVHLRNAMAAVQHEGMLLVLMDLSPGLGTEAVSSVATNILLPLRAEQIVLDGQPVKLPEEIRQVLAADSAAVRSGSATSQPSAGACWSLPAATGSVIGIRHGNAGVALRILAVDGLAGQQPSLALKADGAPWGAGRLVAYHYQGAPRTFSPSDGPVRAAIFIVCRRCESDAQFEALIADARNAQATITEQSATSGAPSWDARLKMAGHELEVSLQSGRPVVRRVDNEDYRPQTFTVNGRDLAAELLNLAPASRSAN
jgi:hypothetical protein